MIRITFTIAQDDLDNIDSIKKTLMKMGIDTNKSEIVRAGIESLMKLSRDEMWDMFEGISKVKVGRKRGE